MRLLANPLPAIVTRLRSAGCVFAEDEARLLASAASTPEALAAMVDRRVTGTPLEYVLGWAQFCGQRVVVEPGVFVPRRRTEFLVRTAVALAPRGHALQRDTVTPGDQMLPSDGQTLEGPRAVVVDLCCGSGAIGLAMVSALEQVELHAVDIDPAAVRCARRNLVAAGGQVYLGDLYDPLPARLRGHVDVLVANAPYVPAAAIETLPPEAREYEPQVALAGGPDGLDILRRIIAAAPGWLAPGGNVLVETSERQSPHVVELIASSGLSAHIATCTQLNATVVVGTSSPSCTTN